MPSQTTCVSLPKRQGIEDWLNIGPHDPMSDCALDAM